MLLSNQSSIIYMGENETKIKKWKELHTSGRCLVVQNAIFGHSHTS